MEQHWQQVAMQCHKQHKQVHICLSLQENLQNIQHSN